MALVGFNFWQGPISAMSVAATVLIALARMQVNQLHLRLLLLAGGGFWVMHDFVGEAWIAVTADIGAAIMGVAALFSLLFQVTIERRPSSPALLVPVPRFERGYASPRRDHYPLIAASDFSWVCFNRARTNYAS
jgi:hypothetical protein